MQVRFGFVAMSTLLKDASPSKTMTLTQFRKLPDREAALARLTRIAAENLRNTLRILRHANSLGIGIYRFSSRLIPLYGHEETAGWDPFPELEGGFKAIGDFVREKGMRVSFHPDHFVVLNSVREAVLEASIRTLALHEHMTQAMGLGPEVKLVLHVGSGAGGHDEAFERLRHGWARVPPSLRERIVLENDDRTFPPEEVLSLCQSLSVPMVLDIHHALIHPGELPLSELLGPIVGTWERTGLPPKVHVSSPQEGGNRRAHADFVRAGDVRPFLTLAAQSTDVLDIMVEAKMKDQAVIRLVKDVGALPEIRVFGEAVT